MTGTATASEILRPLPDDNCTQDSDCNGSGGGSCYFTGAPCSDDNACNPVTRGDFCRYISSSDGSGRSLGDVCGGRTAGLASCRYQARSSNCSSDSNCHSGVGDYCVSGTPANMCQKTGLWCRDDLSGCPAGDTCVPATSRLMMVKNAVRRVVLEHAYDDNAVVKIGHMHTYQADKTGNTANLFPYVKLDTAVGTSTRTEVKFLPRSELLKGTYSSGSCFLASGPTPTCTIDYGGGGAVGTPAVAYSILPSGSGYNSRYAVPTGDGKTYARQDANWCGTLCSLSILSTSSQPNSLYEGSYYTFTYAWGKPVASGYGSVGQPRYETYNRGKSFFDGSTWYLMDAERTEFVNENKYGANEFTGSSWVQGFTAPGNEYHLPLVGASTFDLTAAGATCNGSNGAQSDSGIVPMVNATSFGGRNVTPTQKALLNAARLDKASYGGFYATGNVEPVGCALQNENSSSSGVAGYMSTVRSNDTSTNTANDSEVPCWDNHVLLVVDGLPRGPGEVAGTPDPDNAGHNIDCSAAECTYSDSNPTLSGCYCPAVRKARSLAASGINVHVIAASPDPLARNYYAAATLNNIARAGSTSASFINIPRYAINEDELYYWLNYEMKEALRVTVATTPASAASGSQSMQGITAGNMLFQTTVELPEWRGNLVAFSIGTDTTTTTGTATATTYTTQLAWDAATVNTFTVRPGSPPGTEQQQSWKQRQVFFSDGSGNIQQIGVDSTTGAISPATASALQALGMGGNTVETAQIVQWMLGQIDPSDSIDYKPLNPAVLGSVLSSMPIDVGPPGPSQLPGGTHFSNVYLNRPELVYLGADDGMLHAFYAANGLEAFAFLPADMVPVVAKLYAQGGQRYSPNDHVWGLAGSPKVKNLCVENCGTPAKNLTCSDAADGVYSDGCPKWKTILVMGAGMGGNRPFALDITDAAGSPSLKSDSLLWHAGYTPTSGVLHSTSFGQTLSVPAFAYKRTTGENDVLMVSGTASSNSTTLIDALAGTGAAATPATTTVSGSSTCSQTFEVAADVAIARDNYGNPPDQNLLATYVADTSGTVHQYYGSSLTSDGTPTPISLGCTQPLHFSPAVVQLNRNNKDSKDNTVFLAQVTNSILDPNTNDPNNPSELVVARLLSVVPSSGTTAPAPTKDTSFGTGGSITLAAGPSGQLCGVTATGRTSTDSSCGSGGSTLPATARPTGTPVAVLRSDATGFQLYTTWYDPPKANWDNCAASATSGNSYITVHQFLTAGSGSWAQLYGWMIPHQYVTGVQFAGTTLFITYGDGGAPGTPQPGTFNQTFLTPSQSHMGRLAGDRFVRTAWTERLDAE